MAAERAGGATPDQRLAIESADADEPMSMVSALLRFLRAELPHHSEAYLYAMYRLSRFEPFKQWDEVQTARGVGRGWVPSDHG
jgi:hypothetical protein